MRPGSPVRARSQATSAVAHLLRNLGDPSVLLNNELVRRGGRSFDGAGCADEVARAIGTAVEATLARLEIHEEGSAKRVASILKRCDIGGEPHDRAMRELALSRPEFYRQLRAGRRAVADAVATSLADATPEAEIDRDPLEVRLRGAYALALTGNPDAAVRHLAPLRETLRGLQLVRLACVLSEFRFDSHLEFEALAYLQLARATAELLEGFDRTLAAALIAQVEGVMAYKSGRAFPLAALLEHHLERLRFLPRDPFVADVISTLLILKAAHVMHAGNISEAWAVLHASPAREPDSRVTARTRADHLTLSISLTLRSAAGTLDDATADCAELYRYAVEHGMHSFATAALSERARIAALRGNFRDADFYAGEALASSATFMTPWEHAGVCSVAALIALAARRPHLAVELSREARRILSPAAYPAQLAALYEAEALRMEERFVESYSLCSSVRKDLSDSAPPQLLAFARRIEGEALVALGSARKGRTALGDSRSILGACEYDGDYAAIVRARDAAEA